VGQVKGSVPDFGPGYANIMSMGPYLILTCKILQLSRIFLLLSHSHTFVHVRTEHLRVGLAQAAHFPACQVVNVKEPYRVETFAQV
jgi:hypothetical protein